MKFEQQFKTLLIMNLSVYKTENERRQDYSQITDDHLIKWDPRSQNDHYPQTGPEVLVEGSNDTNFVNRHDFNRRFQLVTHGLLNYIDWNNVIVAGGCISNSINSVVNFGDVSESDVDMFLVGLDEDGVRSKIQELIGDIKAAVYDRPDTRDMDILINKYVISLIVHLPYGKKIKLQIIYNRLYKCIYEILAGFDVDACAVAYDGSEVYLTARSLSAFQNRMNVVDLSRRSPSYEHRLHKYVSRGFGIYIPFDWSNYNKLYFLNRHTRGLDRLLILQRFNRRPGLQKLLNYISKRRNTKFSSSKAVSDYEGSEELTLSTRQALKLSVAKYNQRVNEPFKYSIIDNSAELQALLNAAEFITHNPGQQLTGSFQPITTDDWITVDYKPLNVDFIGRSTTLQSIKAGKEVNLEDLYNLKVRDNSLFNALDYLIMYHPNEDFLINAWDNRHRFMFSSHARNLYNVDELSLAMFCRRYTLAQHIMAKNREKLDNDKGWDMYINLALFLDDLPLLKSIFRYHKNSIFNSSASIFIPKMVVIPIGLNLS